MTLEEALAVRGVCDARVLERGRIVSIETGQDISAVLLQLGLLTETDLAETYSAILGRNVLDASDLAGIERPLRPEQVGAYFVRAARALPFVEGEGILSVLMADPLDDFVAEAIEAATGMRVQREVARISLIEAMIERLYEDPDEPAEEAANGEDGDQSEDDADRLKDLASEAPIIRLVNQIVFRAVETGASDIHIEPGENRLAIRFRYDGVLQEVDSQNVRVTSALISRIKIMARLDIAERRLPQDGRIKLAVRGHDVDFRVSIVPGLHGEIVVLRVLDRSVVRFEYERLGLADDVVVEFRDALDLPNGIVLVTGPTGSGKTTTLYTGLTGMNVSDRNVVTIEDPIEYQLSGINQIQVRAGIGLSFARLLRSLLRQDPDVIMVGEIRDIETAQIAVQAALTGHLVLSTLHTNSAAAAITRLRDMGVEDYLLTAVLRGVLAQRLVRKLCVSCRAAEPVPEALITRFGFDQRKEPRLWRATGCPHCRQTGYRGRLAIAEFLRPTPALVQLILSGADSSAIERQAVADGMITMFRAGLMAALAGETTIEEVGRAVGGEE
ncbi:GspE/PulE family protein [Gluconobacter cerinus]|uniref:GspE/PulE family protein n=1 Tax=Gluconobacter cerinus TaxID=38307 RepID=UPI001B8AA75F|nr:ATPase, T2SS/T4P/T4SS family [Gluconobacter cerinus]MBS1038690.1 Flp pilus assembly complex ATPase component TadA [Gluconobacter cerinus]